MTQLLYQTDSYLKEFSANIVSVDCEMGAFVLDQSPSARNDMTINSPNRGEDLCIADV